MADLICDIAVVSGHLAVVSGHLAVVSGHPAVVSGHLAAVSGHLAHHLNSPPNVTYIMLFCDLFGLRGYSRFIILFIHIMNMDNEDIDTLNTDMDNLNKCLNEYAKKMDDPDNPLTALHWD